MMCSPPDSGWADGLSGHGYRLSGENVRKADVLVSLLSPPLGFPVSSRAIMAVTEDHDPPPRGVKNGPANGGKNRANSDRGLKLSL